MGIAEEPGVETTIRRLFCWNRAVRAAAVNRIGEIEAGMAIDLACALRHQLRHRAMLWIGGYTTAVAGFVCSATIGVLKDSPMPVFICWAIAAAGMLFAEGVMHGTVRGIPPVLDRLVAIDDPVVAPNLLECLDSQLNRLKRPIAAALASLLEQREACKDRLTPAHLRLLRRNVAIWPLTQKYEDWARFAEAALKLLVATGDRESDRLVRALAAAPITNYRDQRLRRLAIACVDELEARAREEDARRALAAKHALLLRPASESPTALLRPASAGDAMNRALLYGAASPKSGEADG